MTWRIRDRATFEALAQTRRLRRGPLSLRYVADVDGSPPRVGFAVGRSAGSAVQRNRLRRRLRAAIAVLEADGRCPPGAYLFGAGPEAVTMQFADLERAVDELVEAARAGTR